MARIHPGFEFTLYIWNTDGDEYHDRCFLNSLRPWQVRQELGPASTRVSCPAAARIALVPC